MSENDTPRAVQDGAAIPIEEADIPFFFDREADKIPDGWYVWNPERDDFSGSEENDSVEFWNPVGERTISLLVERVPGDDGQQPTFRISMYLNGRGSSPRLPSYRSTEDLNHAAALMLGMLHQWRDGFYPQRR